MKFNDIRYGVLYTPKPLFKVEHELAFFDEVKRNTRLVILNGDAEGLEAGTPVYSLDDYVPSFRLAVIQGEEIAVFQAEANPHISKAGELMDIGGKVKSISISDPNKSTIELASITSQEQINKLIGIFLDSPYSNEVLMNPGTKVVYLKLTLSDGTDIRNALWLDSGVYGSFVQLPEEFCTLIRNTIIDQQEKSY